MDTTSPLFLALLANGPIKMDGYTYFLYGGKIRKCKSKRGPRKSRTEGERQTTDRFTETRKMWKIYRRAQTSVCSKSCAAQLWKNNSGSKDIDSNAAPSTPKNLRCSYDKNTRMVTFTWDAASDDATPASALQYNLYLRKAGSSEYFMTVPADPATGFIKVAEISGQIMTTSYSMYVPDENVDYEWGVQAINNRKRGGKFAKSYFNPTTTNLKKKEVSDVNVYVSDGNVCYNVYGQICSAREGLLRSLTMRGSATPTITALWSLLRTLSRVRTKNYI